LGTFGLLVRLTHIAIVAVVAYILLVLSLRLSCYYSFDILVCLQLYITVAVVVLSYIYLIRSLSLLLYFTYPYCCLSLPDPVSTPRLLRLAVPTGRGDMFTCSHLPHYFSGIAGIEFWDET